MIAREFGNHGQIHRLLEEIRRVQSIGCVTVVIIRIRRQYDDGCVLVHHSRCGQNLQTAIAVPAKPEIGHDQIDRELRKQRVLRFGERCCGNHRDIVRGKEVHERFADRDFVFDDEDSFGHTDSKAKVMPARRV